MNNPYLNTFTTFCFYIFRMSCANRWTVRQLSCGSAAYSAFDLLWSAGNEFNSRLLRCSVYIRPRAVCAIKCRITHCKSSDMLCGRTGLQWRRNTRWVLSRVRIFVPDFWVICRSVLKIGALNQKERPYAPSVAYSWLRHCMAWQKVYYSLYYTSYTDGYMITSPADLTAVVLYAMYPILIIFIHHHMVANSNNSNVI